MPWVPLAQVYSHSFLLMFCELQQEPLFRFDASGCLLLILERKGTYQAIYNPTKILFNYGIFFFEG